MTQDLEREERGGFRRIPFAVGLALGLAAYLAAGGLPSSQRATAAVTATVATWWIAGAMPLGAASLFPFVALPLFGVVPVSKVAAAYFDPLIFLFFGGFLLALGIERWGLHRRFAYGVVRAIGTGPRLLVLAFMVATAAISMWLSNTATTLLMLPIALAAVRGMREAGAKPDANFAFALLLGVGYAASIGGMGTPVGTAPNVIFLGQFRSFYPEAPAITFGGWMVGMVPLVFAMTLGTWAILVLIAPPGTVDPSVGRGIREGARALGPWTAAERRMAAVFGLAALLWVFRRTIDLGEWGKIPGWSGLLPAPEAVDDAVVAVGIAFLGFVLPSGTERGMNLLDWETTRKVRWDILLLLGSGFALASAFEGSGLSRTLGDALVPALRGAPPVLLVLGLCALVTAMSEVASNTATAQLMMPLLRGVSAAAGLNPLLLMLPATLAASCGFMLPIATPPNAIVFASGYIPVRRMARVGLLVDLLGIAAIAGLVFLWGGRVLGIATSAAPDWAHTPPPPSGR